MVGGGTACARSAGQLPRSTQQVPCIQDVTSWYTTGLTVIAGLSAVSMQQVRTNHPSFQSGSSNNRHLLLLGALVDERLVDVGDHTTTSNCGLQGSTAAGRQEVSDVSQV